MSDFKRYVSRSTVVARQLEEDETVVTASGPVSAKAGQWVLQSDSGNTVADDESFQDTWGEGAAPKQKDDNSPKGKS